MGMGSVSREQGRRQWIGEPGHGRRQGIPGPGVRAGLWVGALGKVAARVPLPTPPGPPSPRERGFWDGTVAVPYGIVVTEELFPPTGRGCAWANLYWRKWGNCPAWVLG